MPANIARNRRGSWPITSQSPSSRQTSKRRNHVFYETRMSTIGGPGGIGGPKGPKPPDGADGDAEISDVGTNAETSAAQGVGQADIDAIASDIAAGKLTPREAVDRLVDQMAGTDVLDPADRAELREIMSDLVANDPHLQSLLGRV
jgi:hypothetical protein